MNEREKSYLVEEEYSQNDHVNVVGLGIVFIWGGLVLLVKNTGYSSNFSWWDTWSVFFIGVGAIVLLIFVIRLLKSEYSSPSFFSLLFALVLIGIGLGGPEVWFWPAVLFIIGIIVLLSAFYSGDLD
jgi:uncharacterized membrane protein